jgi:hypothetical protein
MCAGAHAANVPLLHATSVTHRGGACTPAVATGASTLRAPFDMATPVLQRAHVLLNERLFEKGVRTDFSSVLAMAAVIGLIAISSALSANRGDDDTSLRQASASVACVQFVSAKHVSGCVSVGLGGDDLWRRLWYVGS